MLIKKPMLAERITNFDALRFPLLASPKYDGIRALTRNGELVSRNLKPIPNDYVRSLADGLPDGLDGELILDDGTEAGAKFNQTSSAVMRQDGSPKVRYLIFDYVKDSLTKPASDRIADLKVLFATDPHISWRTVIVDQTIVGDLEDLLDYEELTLERGYEGVMVRDPNSPYKEGRSSEAEAYLLKLKRFMDSEAQIVGFEEQQHNANTLEKDLLGYAKRSSAKGGMVPAGTLGKLYVKDIHSGIEFEIGTGFDDALRLKIWKNTKQYAGKIVKYKYQSCGMKDKPRFPVFLGFRDKRDM